MRAARSFHRMDAGCSTSRTLRAGRRSTSGAIRRWIGSGRSRKAAACSRGGAVTTGRSTTAAADTSSPRRSTPQARDPVFGKPTALFADDYDFGAGASIANYDVTPDGRFIMIRRGTNGGKLRVIVNWTEELKQILAAGGIR